MTDEDHAAQIRRAADELVVVMEKAAQAGLMIDVKLSPSGRTDGGGKPTKIYGWRHNTSITRVHVC